MKDFQAFPLSSYEDWDKTEVNGQAGMSLRDYFAGQALLSVLNTVALENLPMSSKNIAKLCYARADAMLNARGE